MIENMSFARKFTLIATLIGAFVIFRYSFDIWERNDMGFIQVKQAWYTGTPSVRLEAGTYAQNFGKITTYKLSDVYDFGAREYQIGVRFNDAATANISGQIKFRLPSTEEGILKIHRDFRSYEAVHNDLVRQVVAAALKQSATFFRAEDVYSTRRSDFIDMVNDQIKDGIYATSYSEEWRKDDLDDTKTKLIRKVEVRRNASGAPIVNEVSAFKLYNIELIQIVINDIDFDDLTDALIVKRKDAEQQQVVARANAERAKQDAVTAFEQGRANVAIAEANALVQAKTAIVEAEKNTKVAEQIALQAEQTKKAIIAKGEADAAATKLKVAAGLSPYEQAEFDMNTKIGVAEKLAQVKFPSLLVIGGSSGASSQLNPFDAVGLKTFIDINDQMSKGQR